MVASRLGTARSPSTETVRGTPNETRANAMATACIEARIKAETAQFLNASLNTHIVYVLRRVLTIFSMFYHHQVDTRSDTMLAILLKITADATFLPFKGMRSMSSRCHTSHDTSSRRNFNENDSTLNFCPRSYSLRHILFR